MKAYKASAKYLYSEIDSEAVILDMESGTYFGLNEVSNQIWQWLQTPVLEADLLKLMLGEYDVSTEEARKDLETFLQEMLEVGLVEVVNEEVAPVV